MPELKNKRHERFCLEYSRLGDGTKAYLIAFPNSSHKSAGANAVRLLKNPKVKGRIRELADEIRSSAIADATEIQQRLTSILRGEAQEEVVVVEGIEKGVTEARVISKQPSHADTIKAAQTLCRMQGAYESNVNMNIAVPRIAGENEL